MAPALILASTSPARRALLTQVGLAFEAIAPGVEERLERGLDGTGQARALALQKAQAVAARRPEAIVVGADQVLVFEGETWGKPACAEEAFAQLRRLAGHTHALVTGLAILAPGQRPVAEHEESRLTLRELSDDELRAYVATGEWEGCAGSYRLEGRGLALFSRLEGDHTNVLGLPMPRLLTSLRALGIALFPG